jgi:hypothetical protein
MQVRLNITLCFALRRYAVNSGCQLDLDARLRVRPLDRYTRPALPPTDFNQPTSSISYTHTRTVTHMRSSPSHTQSFPPSLSSHSTRSQSASLLIRHCCDDPCSSHGTVLSPRCSGSTRWVHQRCILRWINDPDHTCGADRRGCPNGCGAIYTLSEAPESLLVQVKWMPLPHSPHAYTRQGQPALIISPVPSSSWSSLGA